MQDTLVLHSYNAHNDYVMQLSGFNHLHEEFYSKQVFDMLNELQVCVCSCVIIREYHFLRLYSHSQKYQKLISAKICHLN